MNMIFYKMKEIILKNNIRCLNYKYNNYKIIKI